MAETAPIDTISKILTAIDGSEPSMHAASYAILVAGKFNAELWVIHVVQHSGFVNMYSYGIYDLETPEEHKAILEDLRADTKEWFNRIKVVADQNKVQLTRAELVGTSTSVESAIADYAKKNLIDTIVIGTSGRSGIKKLFLGSVASGIIKHTHCPVMVVK
jgi:nucleotide-binding universal stress UspA family protein